MGHAARGGEDGARGDGETVSRLAPLRGMAGLQVGGPRSSRNWQGVSQATEDDSELGQLHPGRGEAHPFTDTLAKVIERGFAWQK